MPHTETRQTELQSYIRGLHKIADHLPHDIDRVAFRHALAGLKKELDVEYDVGINKKCPQRKKRIKKSLEDFRKAATDILRKAVPTGTSKPPASGTLGQPRKDVGKERAKHRWVKREKIGEIMLPGGAKKIQYKYYYQTPEGKDYSSKEEPLPIHKEDKKKELQNRYKELLRQKVALRQHSEDHHVNVDEKMKPITDDIKKVWENIKELSKPGKTETGASDKEIVAYVKEWEEIKNSLENSFTKYCDAGTEKEADALFESGKTTGLNITRYAVYHKASFNDFFSKESKISVTMYNGDKEKEYTGGMLKAVRSEVGDVPYAVTERASKFQWDEKEWGKPSNGSKVGDKVYERAGEHNIVFAPKNKKQMAALLEAVGKYQDKKAYPEGDIRHDVGWVVPDNRSNVEIKDYKKVHFNFKYGTGGRVITTMTSENPLDTSAFGKEKGYSSKPCWVNSGMLEWMAKSLEIIIDLIKSGDFFTEFYIKSNR